MTGSLTAMPPGPAPHDAVKRVGDVPSSVFVEPDAGSGFQRADRSGSRFTARGIAVELRPAVNGQEVRVAASGPLSRAILRWELSLPEETLYLGDAWERSYGDLQWRFLQPERIMPWYFAAHAPGFGTFMAGVKTQPSALVLLACR